VKDQTYCNKKPVAFVWWWVGGGGHVMVVRGYKTVSGQNYVYMNNRSSITLTQEGGKWTAAAFGGAKLIRQLTKVRNALVPSANIFVKVPALNVYFIARQEEGAAGGLMLTPLTDQPEYRMKEGGALPAKEAFSALVPAAKAHDGKTS
jgi:hypothetical protein